MTHSRHQGNYTQAWPLVGKVECFIAYVEGEEVGRYDTPQEAAHVVRTERERYGRIVDIRRIIDGPKRP